MEKIKLCPFCGSEAKVFESKGTWGVVCQNIELVCNARIPYCHFEEDAIQQWNTRI